MTTMGYFQVTGFVSQNIDEKLVGESGITVLGFYSKEVAKQLIAFLAGESVTLVFMAPFFGGLI